jgi:hypothetical protein
MLDQHRSSHNTQSDFVEIKKIKTDKFFFVFLLK